MERIKYEARGPVAVIRLDDGKANAIQGELLAQLDGCLDRAERDPEITAVVLTGRAGYFSAGLDLRTLPTLSRPDLRRTILDFGRVMLRVHACPKPTVAAVTGHALAGGCVLLLACDFRLAARGPFKIGLNEVAIGLPLPTFVLELARATLTPAALHEALLLAKVYDPEGALAAGYLHELAEAGDLAERAMAQARDLGVLPPVAYSETKRRLKELAIRRGVETAEAEIDAFFTTGPFAG